MRILLNKEELIQYTNGKLRPDTLGRLTREGKIPVVKFPGIRRFFYDQKAIDQWLDDLQMGPKEPTNIVEYEKHRKIQAI